MLSSLDSYLALPYSEIVSRQRSSAKSCKFMLSYAKSCELTQQGKDTLCQMNAYWQAIRNETDSIEKGYK